MTFSSDKLPNEQEASPQSRYPLSSVHQQMLDKPRHNPGKEQNCRSCCGHIGTSPGCPQGSTNVLGMSLPAPKPLTATKGTKPKSLGTWLSQGPACPPWQCCRRSSVAIQIRKAEAQIKPKYHSQPRYSQQERTERSGPSLGDEENVHS